MPGARAVEQAALRWRCDVACLDFESTDEVAPVDGVVGQQVAWDALRFGLEIRAPGQNIFVRGARGTGRLTLARSLAEEVRKGRAPGRDAVLVHNFVLPNRPRLLRLPAGQGPVLERRLEVFSAWVGEGLPAFLESERVQGRLVAARQESENELRAHSQPFEKELAEANLALVGVQGEGGTRPLIVPVVDGTPTPPPDLARLMSEGKVTEADLKQIQQRIAEFEPRLREVQSRARQLQRDTQGSVNKLLEQLVADAANEALHEVRVGHPEAAVQAWLDELVGDLSSHLGRQRDEGPASLRRFLANVLVTHDPAGPAPLVVEDAPSASALVGGIDPLMLPDGTPVADHLGIRGGSLLAADGGFLILEAEELVSEPGAWRSLIRALRVGRVSWELPERRSPLLLKPEAAPVDVKVILLGPPELYALLDDQDRDFGELFKVLADFESMLSRDLDGCRMYAAVIARLVRDEGLRPFDRSAVRALIEHGARIAAQADRLTARFGRLGDIVREAAFLASKEGASYTTGEHVRETVRRTKERAMLPARRYWTAVARGTYRIAVAGTAVGQVNGLAVLHSGPLTYGFPTRITATVGAGTGGTVNVEGMAALSGQIHTKGFHILGGVLRTLLASRHPLTFDASIAFEQSYGGIDGDSASGAELVALLSALVGEPARQDLAMTGAIDQRGQILPIGAVNEKIEGFFDVCHEVGFTGTQGVLIPRSNTGDLMLREDVVAACGRGDFHVWSIDRIEDALELFLGAPAGSLRGDGSYSPDSLLGRAMTRVRELWEMTRS